MWKGGKGSRLDRCYLSADLAHAVEKTSVKASCGIDHLAIITSVREGGARKRSFSRCFVANRELVDSAEGRRVVTEATHACRDRSPPARDNVSGRSVVGC